MEGEGLRRGVLCALTLAVLCVLAMGSAVDFVVEAKGKYYHRPGCALLRELKIEDLIFVRTPRAAAQYKREPCPVCKPPLAGAARTPVALREMVALTADVRAKIYHRVGCDALTRVPSAAQKPFCTFAEGRDLGCKPCPECKPPSLEDLRAAEAAAEKEMPDALKPEARVKADLVKEQIVSVPADKPFVETGIHVEKGQFVLLRAWGRIKVASRVEQGGELPLWGPDGATIKGKPRYCLMARVGGQVVQAGRERGFQAERSGGLCLGVLDEPDGYKDNEGAFEVWVRVLTPAGAIRRVAPPRDSEPKPAPGTN